MNRRLKGFIVSGNSLAMMIREGFRTIEVGKAIPPSAEFYTAYFSHDRNAFVCVFEDESFGSICDGALIPVDLQPWIVEIGINDEPAGWRTELEGE